MPIAKDLKFQYKNMRNGKLFNIGELVLPTLTTTERDALTPTIGMIIYNSTTNKLNFYDSTWRVLTST